MISNPSPKQRFLMVSADVEAVNELVASRIFEKATDTALLQYQEQLHFNPGTPGDMTQAAGNYLRLLGAREVLFILRNLGQKETTNTKPADLVNLEQRKS